MLEKFNQWYNKYYTEFTWFLIGFLVMAGLADLAQHDYPGAMLSFAIAFVNYWFVKK